MSDDAGNVVWYAAYGSNLSWERFRVYLEGGPVPDSPNGRIQRGARDPTSPSGDQPFAIDRGLYFAGVSKLWGGGGVAFLDADHTPPQPTLGRAWRLARDQFEDVFAQENGLDHAPRLPIDQVVASGRVDVSPDRYGRVEWLGSIDGEPVVTFTRPSPLRPLNAAHPSYLRTIATGLVEAWELTEDAAHRYLAGLPGNTGEAGGPT